jgi:hypothetical protein
MTDLETLTHCHYFLYMEYENQVILKHNVKLEYIVKQYMNQKEEAIPEK